MSMNDGSMALNHRWMKWGLNLYPPYLFTGTRIKYIAPDWSEVIVQLKKTPLTRNYVGTIFGGSIYAAADPFYMFMCIKALGLKDYIIWDKKAEIDFKKPARTSLTFHFKLGSERVVDLKNQLETNKKILPEFSVDGVDAEGAVCVTVNKLVYIRKKNPTSL
jgi:acyl-coenzyme A thioesterase PaaI-like protein